MFWFIVDAVLTLGIFLIVVFSVWDIPDSYEYQVYDYKRNKKELFLSMYKQIGIRFDSIVVTQNFLETGNFTSTIFKENKNMFGMKYNQRGFAIGKNRGHAQYADYESAAKDYLAWQTIRIRDYERYYGKKIVTDEDYYDLLNHVVIYGKTGKAGVYSYAEDPDYTRKLQRVKQDLFNK